MHRYIDWCQLITNDSICVFILHIRQSHIVSLQERQSRIIIFKIQRLPHVRWHLINKTKNTFIVTGFIIIHQTVFKNNPRILVIIFLYLQFPFFSVWFTDQQSQQYIVNQKMIIKNILNRLSIYFQQNIAYFDSHLFRDTSRFDAVDFVFF